MPPDAMSPDAVLEVRNLRVSIGGRQIVDIDALDIRAGGRLGLVGESGSGKTMTGMSIVGLLPPDAVVEGSIRFAGRELIGCTDKDLAAVRGAEIGVIFQDPSRALNPMMRVGRQVAEALRLHRSMTRPERRQRVLELLTQVQLPEPATLARRYPHQLSGGQQQRVLIAMAIACDPRLLIADEPTTALDVTVQAQILDLIAQLSREEQMAVVLITHDLGLVARYADRVVVMYGGRAVETASTDGIFDRPSHPYTRDLLRSRPNIGAERLHRLAAIPGSPPDGRTAVVGCAYAPRCGDADDRCRHEAPPRRAVAADHDADCWRAVDEPARRPALEAT